MTIAITELDELMVLRNSTKPVVESSAIVTVLSAEYVGHPSGVTYRVIVSDDAGELFAGHVIQRGEASPRVILTRNLDVLTELLGAQLEADSADRDWN